MINHPDRLSRARRKESNSSASPWNGKPALSTYLHKQLDVTLRWNYLTSDSSGSTLLLRVGVPQYLFFLFALVSRHTQIPEIVTILQGRKEGGTAHAQSHKGDLV